MEKFTIKNETLEKLKEKFGHGLELLNKALKDNYMVIVRHHADTDGYSAALCLEQAIVPNLRESPRYVYRRAPSKTPFYDYGDALKDLDTFDASRTYGRKCLLILTDMGSGEESKLSLERAKSYGVTIMIIDHHVFNNETIALADVYINPHSVGGNSDLCAGILCYEFAKQMKKDINPIYPALAAVADKSSISEYNKGFDTEYLRKIVICIDFEAFNLRFMETDSILDFFNENKAVIDFLHKDIEKNLALQKEVVKNYMNKKEINGITIASIDMDQLNPTDFFGARSVSLMSSMIEGPKLCYAYGDSIIKFRADSVNFVISDLIQCLRQQFPFALVEGGGHDKAGSIRFLAAARQDVFRFLDDYLQKLRKE